MLNNLPYLHVLREIDKLREKGIADSDPKMMKLRIQLRDYLEQINKNKPKKSVVPTLMSIKTVKFEQPQIKPKKAETTLQKIIPIDTVTLGEIKKEHYAKYALLGTIIAIAALIYKWYREKS